MWMDLEQAVKIVRIARIGNRALKGRRKLRGIFEIHGAHTNKMLNGADMFRRVRDKQVVAEDVHTGARFILRMGPKTYRKIIRAQKNRKDAKGSAQT